MLLCQHVNKLITITASITSGGGGGGGVSVRGLRRKSDFILRSPACGLSNVTRSVGLPEIT